MPVRESLTYQIVATLENAQRILEPEGYLYFLEEITELTTKRLHEQLKIAKENSNE